LAHSTNEASETCDFTSFIQDTALLNPRERLDVQEDVVFKEVVSEKSQPVPSLSVPPPRKASLTQLWSSIPVLGAPNLPSHPFPSLDWSEVRFPAVLICAAVLFAAGVLCSAGGIGGGGVYVTVLMVAGSLSPHDAVPLSKAVVFCGSLSSLVLNLRKSLCEAAGGKEKVLIDFNVCRLVVPSALFGTFMGVLLNSKVAPWLIVAMLAKILIMMTFMSCKEFYRHYKEERHDKSSGDADLGEASDASTPSVRQPSSQMCASARGILLEGEGFAAFLLLVLVVCCGAFRAHAAACQLDLAQDMSNKFGRDACERPFIKAIIGSTLMRWMAPGSPLAGVLLHGAVFIPMAVCLMIVIGYSCIMLRREDWLMQEVFLYCIMAILTGCFAGLVGIGGGLIFSPFFLWMTGDPAVAVATSSTCVIFTSSSTTFQYLLTDRIAMSLAIIYGTINAAASYVGTTSVHALDTLQSRKTLISGIVCLGVLASVVLSVYKLISMGV